MNFSKISIENFRGIRTCNIKDLGLVNVFFGKNNCGKSSLLEAIFLMTGPSNPTLPILVNNLRQLVSFREEDILTDFYGLNSENIIRIQGDGQNKRDVCVTMIKSHTSQVILDQLSQINSEQSGKRYGLKLEYRVGESEHLYHTELIIDPKEETSAHAKTDKAYNETLHAEYIPSGNVMLHADEKLAQIIVDKRESEIVEALKLVEPRIKDIVLINKKIMVDIGLESRLPINVLGDGVRKVLSILLAIHSAKGGSLMIDEIDNGLHYSIMPALWNVILHSCKTQDTQLFVSTHSADFVEALVDVMSQEGLADTNVSAYKLVKKYDDELVALRYDKEKLTYAINQEMEVR
ncbi:MAG: AAA family ATPase [Bacteroidales bacterium]|nr:AAA family ATPase [Bacteroidales bacterium]